jgi:hypothetical protein
VTTAAIDLASECCDMSMVATDEWKKVKLTLLASVAVHMSLQRAWTCEAFVANLALVLLLAA